MDAFLVSSRFLSLTRLFWIISVREFYALFARSLQPHCDGMNAREYVPVAAQLVVKYKNPKYMSAFGQSINTLGNALMGFHCSFVCRCLSDGDAPLFYLTLFTVSLVARLAHTHSLTHSFVRILWRAKIYANNGQLNAVTVAGDDDGAFALALLLQ